MDVTKLFEGDKVEPLSDARLDAMIDKAVTYPQISIPANENTQWFKRALAVAAAVVIAVTISLQYMPNMTSGVSTASSNDAYDEISDLLILETLNDLS